jgi:hypothetical protein
MIVHSLRRGGDGRAGGQTADPGAHEKLPAR